MTYIRGQEKTKNRIKEGTLQQIGLWGRILNYTLPSFFAVSYSDPLEIKHLKVFYSCSVHISPSSLWFSWCSKKKKSLKNILLMLTPLSFLSSLLQVSSTFCSWLPHKRERSTHKSYSEQDYDDASIAFWKLHCTFSSPDLLQCLEQWELWPHKQPDG